VDLPSGRVTADEYAPLVRAAAAGDEQALDRLLQRAQEVAYRFSLLVCGHTEDAEDVMQEALVKTYRHLRRIREPEAFRTWLFRTVRNACLVKRRRRADEPSRLESLAPTDAGALPGSTGIDLPDQRKGPDELAVNAWLGARLRQALVAIPPQLRVIVLLREMEGLSTRETAEVMGISEANVKQRLHRARALLRAELGDVDVQPFRRRLM
jgi:RNA polymerase sigma-70 factor (ECF subfamily)